MYKAVILPLANHDIKEAALWYNNEQPGLGKRFTTQIRQKIKLIKDDPELAPVRYDNIRTAVLDVFPFMIHYSIDHSLKLIVISAVLHTSRNPDIWKSDRNSSD